MEHIRLLFGSMKRNGYSLFTTALEIPVFLCSSICFISILHLPFFFWLGTSMWIGTILITAGGLLNATCGNVPELIIALFALHKEKMEILKWSLLGSILSNLLLVLGSSLLCGGLANTGKERPLDRVRMQLNSTIVLPVELRNTVLEK